ncbi:MAG TPA: hypothetical protein VFS05_02310 [Gemmatimonadaceae bacterium]|nr:hypothetical protein [Gemmatimonadaceae bacterium]
MSGRDLTDERARQLYQQSLAARAGGARDRCASPEAILALVRREGAEEERLATLDHVMACDACSREFELLRAIERAGSESGAAGVRASPAAARARWRWQRIAPLALAASLALAVGIGVVRERGTVPDTDVVRGGAEDGVTLVAPGEEVGTGREVIFVWRAVPGASRYELELLAPGGAVLSAITTGDTVAALPATARLARGAEYRWWVRARLPGGDQLASPLRPLRVRSE